MRKIKKNKKIRKVLKKKTKKEIIQETKEEIYKNIAQQFGIIDEIQLIALKNKYDKILEEKIEKYIDNPDKLMKELNNEIKESKKIQ